MLYTYAKNIETFVLEHDKIALKDMIIIIGDDYILILLILLSILNIVLSPLPMNSVLLGVPLLLFSSLYLLNVDVEKKNLKILSKQFSCIKWRSYITKLTPYLQKFQTLSRSRWRKILVFENRIISGLCLCLFASIVLMPIPFANIPGSVGIILISLGILQKDGFFVLLGYLIFALHILGFFMLRHFLMII